MGCNAEEVRVFDGIARGSPPSDYNPEILKHLEEKGLLSMLGHDATIPLMVMHQWSDYQKLIVWGEPGVSQEQRA